MAVHASATIAQAASGWDITTTDYVVGVHYLVRDGANTLIGPLRVDVSIPFGTDSFKANQMLRDAVASEIFSGQGLSISAEDIYFPHLTL